MKCLRFLLRCLFSVCVLASAHSAYGSAEEWHPKNGDPRKLDRINENILAPGKKFRFHEPIVLPNGATLHVTFQIGMQQTEGVFIHIFDGGHIDLRSLHLTGGDYINPFQFMLRGDANLQAFVNKIYAAEQFKKKEEDSEDTLKIHHF